MRRFFNSIYNRLVEGLQLKRLEAYGFKSFADKIEVEFDHGVTAVVGPNGSGKSNITDAIRWVLGENNVRNLRGTKTEDIIFAGSAERRALGGAEVSLTLLNQGDLPVAYDEVVITRRIYRNGDSEFRLNGTPCRLKDIHALLADTGLGHDGLSVISQNKIDAVLNSRPEERRLFFEETAGITKYRDRKRETVRKLKDTEENLSKVDVLLQEIERQLGPLSEEAERAERYNAWTGELRRCKITDLSRAQAALRAQEEESEKRLEARRQEEIAAGTEIRELEAKKEALEKTLIDLGQALQKKSEEKNALQAQIHQKETEIEVLEDRRQHSDEDQKRLKEKKEALEAERKTAEEAHGKLLEAEREAQDAQREAEEKLAGIQSDAKKIAETLRGRKQIADDLAKKCLEKQQTLSSLETDYALLEQGIENSRRESEQQAEDIKRGEAQLVEDKAQLSKLSEKTKALEGELATLSALQKSSEAKRRSLVERQRSSQQALRIAQTYIDQTEGKLEYLRQAQESYEGFGLAAKAVLTAAEPWRRGVCGAVAELIETSKEYLTAVEAALGGAQQNVVTRDTDTAKEAIAFLKRRKAGRVTFLPLSTLTVRGGGNEDARRMQGVIGYMNEVVGAAEEFRKVVDFLLGRTLLVDTMDHALAVAKRQGYRIRIVTLSGELLHPGGSISGGSLQGKETGFLNRREEITRLERALVEQKEKVEAARREEEAAAKEAKEIEDASAGRKEKIQDLRVEIGRTGVAKEKLAEQTEANEIRLRAYKELTEKAAQTFAENENRRTQMVRAVRELRRELETTQQELERARDVVADLEQESEDFGRSVNQAGAEVDTLRSAAFQRHQNVLLKAKDLERIQRDLEENREAAERLLSGLDEGSTQIRALKEENRVLLEALAVVDEAYRAVDRDRLERETEKHETEIDVGQLRHKQTKLKDKLNEIQLEAERLKIQREQNTATLAEEYGLTAEEAAEMALPLGEKELRDRVQTLERDIEALGAVNLSAVEKYREESERYNFYRRQIQDMNESKKKLAELIREMDATMTRQFKETFADVQKAFREIFIALFDGRDDGDARLLLTDEQNVLESGVEIVVQIPGKKQQNLSVLSGGERALTVIALLFSFLRVRPAPFSVLDEIDAPLDETNIANFGRFLKKFSEKTQFVVVTHRKGTMESADTMYGVTLEDAGVSKIISVKFGDVTE